MIDSIRSVSSSHLEQSMDIQTVSSPVSKGIARRFSSMESFEERNNVYSGTGGVEKIKKIFDCIFSGMLTCFEKLKAVFIPKKEENTPPPLEEPDLESEGRIPEQGQGSPLEQLVGLLRTAGVSKEAVVQSFGRLEPAIQNQIKESMRQAIARDFLDALITPSRQRYLELEQHEIPDELQIVEESFEGILKGDIKGLEASIADEKIRDVLSSDSLFRTVLLQVNEPRYLGHKNELLHLLNGEDVTLGAVGDSFVRPRSRTPSVALHLVLRMAKELFLLNTTAKATRLINTWITSEAIGHIITGQDIPQLNEGDLKVLLPVQQRGCPNYYPIVSRAYREALVQFSPEGISQSLLNTEGPRAYFVNAVNAL